MKLCLAIFTIKNAPSVKKKILTSMFESGHMYPYSNSKVGFFDGGVNHKC